jgi:23S rRNA (adenine2503-C2)-methyltransferase
MLDLLGMNFVEMTAHVQRAGFPAMRARQLFHWLYEKGAADFDQMRNLPKDFRAWLSENARLGGAQAREIAKSSDESAKILWSLPDGEHVEGVLMHEKGRSALCVSSQVGCPLGCKFCVTGTGGFRRNCTTGEMIGQVLQASKMLEAEGRTLSNVVFMGMGEPLLNLEALIPALQLIISPQALKIASRRITVSTAGVIVGIHALSDAALNVKLAVSLNATNDKLRRRLMPVALGNPLFKLLGACREFADKSPNRHRVTFEYVLLNGVNDSDADMRELVRLVSDIPCKINLIPFNPDPRLPFTRPSDARVEAIRDNLLAAKVDVAVRHSKGRDIHAACGQLALRTAKRGGVPHA